MKKYDINKAHNNMTVKLVSIKLQIDEYVGYLKVKMGGNASPLSVMGDIFEDIYANDFENDATLNPEFTTMEDQETGTWFHMILKRPDGDSCTVEDELKMLEYYVTGIELVGLEVE